MSQFHYLIYIILEANNNINYQKANEISLRDLIFKIQEFYTEIIKHWNFVIFITIPFIIYFGYKSHITKPNYSATLTFMLNTNEGGGQGGIGSLLGQFGLGGRGSEYSKEKMMSLNKSRRIIEKAIFEKAEFDGTNKFIANHLIHHLDTLGNWTKTKWYKKPFSKPSILQGFRFKNGDIKNFNDTSRTALKTIFSKIIGDVKTGGSSILSNGFDPESGIMYITTSTNNPKLSIALTNVIFDELSEFYINKTIEKQKVTYDILKEKHDSIFSLLTNKEANLAAWNDSSLGGWDNKSSLTKKRLKNDIHKLTLMYGEIIKNLEISDFTLRNKTPFVQPIDRPILPLDAEKTSLFKSMFIGGFLGLFLSILFITIRKILREVMS